MYTFVVLATPLLLTLNVKYRSTKDLHMLNILAYKCGYLNTFGMYLVCKHLAVSFTLVQV